MQKVFITCILLTVFPSEPRRGSLAHQIKFHSFQEGVHIKNQIKSRFVRSFLDINNHYLFVRFYRQPFSIFL